MNQTTREITVSAEDLDMTEPDAEYGAFDLAKAEAMAKSIEYDGLIQLPTIVPIEGNVGRQLYRVIMGRHRVYAMVKILGWKHVTAHVTEGLDADEIESKQLAENLFRRNITGPPQDKAMQRWLVIYEKRHEGNIRGSGPKPKDPAKAAAQVDPFAKVVQYTLGVSKTQAYRLAAVAKNLNEKQIDKLAQAGVGEEVIKDVAALADKSQIAAAVKVIAKGTDPEEAIRQAKVRKSPKPTPKVAGSGKKTSEIKAQQEEESKKPAGEKTDAEWLDELCSRVTRGMKSSVRYKRDAILFRRIYKAIYAFRASAKKAVAEAKYVDGNGLFFMNVMRLLKCKHPGEWVVCGACEGSCKEPNDPKGGWCKSCIGGGYKLTMED